MEEEFKILFSSEVIHKRICELGEKITDDYRNRELVAVGVLKGAFIFMADLVRAIKLPLACEFVRVSSYGSQKTSSGNIQFLLDVPPENISGKHVLIVEDIVDTGNSISCLTNHLKKYSPLSIKICALLFKEAQLKHKITVDYVGFKIESLFVIGYGLDLAEKYRNIPDVRIHP